mgnify:CR=1 FL=1
MAEQLGIENMKKVIRFGSRIGKKISGLVKDDADTLAYLGLIPYLAEIPEIVASAPDLKAELNDYSLEERAEIRNVVTEEFEGAVEAEIEEVVQNSLDVAAAIYTLAGSQIFKGKQGVN